MAISLTIILMLKNITRDFYNRFIKVNCQEKLPGGQTQQILKRNEPFTRSEGPGRLPD